MNSYEVEIKCLLGGKENADNLLKRMEAMAPRLKPTSFHKQLNHYFTAGDLHQLFKNTSQFIGESKQDTFCQIAETAKDPVELRNGASYSVRTRQADDKVLLVVKASVDEGTSANTVARMEFEAETPSLTLEELDKLVLKSGFEYQAKWSRERAEYKFMDVNVTIDKNAGYGYLAEFEKVVDDEAQVPAAKAELKNLIGELNLEELPQDRLERMFAFYNSHWPDYYGTDKVFIVE